jgi:hypothetical protein
MMSSDTEDMPIGRRVNMAELAVMVHGMQASLQDMRAEFRDKLSRLVDRDVYQEARSADQLRMNRLETEVEKLRDDREQYRRIVFGAVVTSGVTFIGTLIMFFLTLTHH